MNLQGRELKRDLRGDDVALLHRELGVSIDPVEVQQRVFGETTRAAVVAFQRLHGLQPTGIVDAGTARRINEVLAAQRGEAGAGDGRFVVRGTVRHASGEPFTAGRVQAFDQDMRSRERLGEARPDARGRYEIFYTPEQFARAEKGSADLRIGVTNDAGREIALSETRFNAASEETIDLVVPLAGASEYERYVRALEPVRQDVPVADLTESDRAFLAPELQMDRGHLDSLVTAHRLARELETEPELLYGLLRGGLPSTVKGLLAAAPPAHRRAIEEALRGNIVPEALRERLDEQLERLRTALLRRADAAATEDERPRVVQVLQTTHLSPESRRKVVDRVLQLDRSAGAAELRARLVEELGPAEVGELETALRLDAFSGGNLPLVQDLQRRRQVGEITGVRDLTKVSRDEWKHRLRGLARNGEIPLPPHVRGRTPDGRLDRYVAGLVDSLQAAFPVDYLRREQERQPELDLATVRALRSVHPRLDRRRSLPRRVVDTLPEGERRGARAAWLRVAAELRAFPGLDPEQVLGAASFDNPIRRGVNRVLVNVPELDALRTVAIDRVLTERGDAAFSGVAPELRAAVTQQLKAMQRVLRVAPRPDDTMTLLYAGFRDAASIARLPQRRFAHLYGQALGGEQRALAIHRQARHRAAASEIVYTAAKQAFTEVLPYVIGGGPHAQAAKVQQLVEQEPSLASLFGSQDYCDCEHCRSVYSPAAYLVDLLHFLDVEPPTKPADTPAQSSQLLSDLALLGDVTITISPSQPIAQLSDLASLAQVIIDVSPEQQPTQTAPDFLWIAKDFLSVAIPAPAGDPTPLEVLLFRRPDLEHLRLSCENTLTPIPYIDLVNEVLESFLVSAFVYAESPAQINAFDVAGATAEELRAVPQHVNEAAYEALKQAVYPTTLPFDRPREVIAAYLGHLGTSRHELIAVVPLGPSAPSPEPGWGADEAKAAEALGLSRRERDLIVGAHAEPLRALYGYASDSVPVEGGSEPWQENLSRVPVLLQRTGLTLDELIELLRTQFLNPDLRQPGQVISGGVLGEAPAAITLQAEGLDCDVAKLRLRAPDVATRDQFLDRAQRFVRLQRKLGWSIPDLDRTLASLGGNAIVPGENGTLVKLAAVLELKKRLRRPNPPDLRTLWSDIDTWGEDSLYARLFQNRAAASPGQLAAFALTPDGTELAHPDQDLIDHTAVLLGALGLTATELETLLDAVPLTSNSEGQAALTLANLSMLYRYKVLARALRLRLDELMSLVELAGVDPFTTHDPRAALRFVEVAEQVDRSRFDVAELEYLFRNRVHAARDPSPSAETVGSTLAKIRDALAATAAELTVPGVEVAGPGQPPFVRPAEVWAAADPTGTVLRERLALAAAPLPDAGSPTPNAPAPNVAELQGVVEIAMGLLLGERTKLPLPEDADPVPFFQTFFSEHFAAEDSVDFLEPVDLAEIAPSVQQLFATQVEEDKPPLVAANIGWLYTKLMPWLWQRRARGVVAQVLADLLGLDSSLVRWLLDGGIDPPGNAATAMDELLRLLGVASEPAHEEPIRLLYKCALLIRRFELSEREVVYLSASGALFEGFDLDLLAPSAGADPVLLFGQWRRLYEVTALRDGLPKTGTPLVQLFEEASKPGAGIEDLREIWAALTGWSADEVAELTGAEGLGLTIEAFRTETQLRGLVRLRELRKRVGVALPTLQAWATAPPDANQARAVVQAVKAKYDHDQWLEVARALNDPLRERQRDALVAFLLPRMPGGGFASADWLFEHFLLDVQMSSCMATSRIKQAISSVQLFVQRCLLNLEPEVSPDAIDAQQWKWRKNYRVWEANRKVFLYPENWIEPELRLDKSPFFRELESELLQSELSEENVERAFLHYLQKLDEVARLEVCGLYWELGLPNGVDVIHVFGRTSNPPRRHFYRRLLGGTEWTPWERVEIDIQSDHLIPVVFDGRLLLFWADFVEKPIPGQDNATGAPPKLLWEIRIQWSEYQDGRWTAPMTSSETIRSYPWMTPPSGAAPTGPPEPLKPSDYQLGQVVQTDPSTPPASLGKILPVRVWFVAYQVFVDQSLDPDYPTKPPPVPGVVWSTLVTHDYWNLQLEFWFEGTAPGWEVSSPGTQKWDGYGKWRTAYLEWLNQRNLTSMVSQTKAAIPIQLQEIGAAYQPVPSPGKPPSKSDHTFRVVPRRDRLEVECLILTTAEDLPAANVVGRFWMDRCRGELKMATQWPGPSVNYPSSGARPLTTASNMLVHNQGFSSRGTTLAAFEFQPASKVLLKVGASPHVVPPAQYPLFYFPLPFALRPHDRTYLARPVRYRPLALALGDADSSAPVAFLQATLAGEAASPIHTGGMPASIMPLSGGANAQPWLGHVATGAQSFTAHQERLVSRFAGTSEVQIPLAPDLRFHTFQQPWVCDYIEDLRRGGLDAMLTLANQTLSGDTGGNSFAQRYQPTTRVAWPHPRFDVDFEPDGAYSLYNWELFFHACMLIAERKRQEQRHEEARRWYHYIFDPTTDADAADVPRRFWKLRPFRDNTEYQRVVDLVRALGDPNPDPATAALKVKVAAQVEEWERRPFEPHRIARLRLLAYQKNVVMKYVQNLIDWADLLFRRDTIESINEATQLYVLAAGILGQRPRRIPAIVELPPPTFAELRPKLATAGELSNPLVTLENVQVELPFSVGPSEADDADLVGLSLQTLAFCVPNNDKLLSYWDTVEDRLFKIRHCMNIEGIERELPLFEPPIDPALLVKAVAAGLDLGSVLADLHAPLPPYRFTFLMQKAYELVNEVKSLGALFLAAKEKGDAEGLAALRASHERAVLDAMKGVRQQQVAEAGRNREALLAAKALTEAREKHYRTLLEDEDRNRIRPEREHLEQLDEAQQASSARENEEILAAFLAAGPGVSFGVAGKEGTPVNTLSLGGESYAVAARAAALVHAAQASDHSHQSTKASIKAGWQRRDEEWQLQLNLAVKELAQIDKQILAAQIRETIAKQELANLEKQIEQARDVQDFLRYKYTNQQLYNWMVSEVSTVYYQVYKLAYDTAKRCERAFRFERGLQTSDFVQFGYWDNAHKGLMAGERLVLDLRRPEAAHLEKNRREYEITKHVSLLLHDPIALIQLKESGRCEVDLPESFFDTDYPGHYFRRIRSVSLTIPAVVGPYTSINCTITLLKSTIRTDPKAADGQDYLGGDEGRFLHDFAPLQSIATSHAQNDAGMFELNFRDERYLPFEGAGAVSRWRIELPRETNAFDFETITDVVLRISYTAREGGGSLRAAALAARDALREMLPSANAPKPPLRRLFSARHEFPDAWHRFLHPLPDAAQTLELALGSERFPYLLRGREIHIVQVDAYLKPRDDAAPSLPSGGLPLVLETPNGPKPMTLAAAPPAGRIPLARASLPNVDVPDVDEGPGTWTLRVDAPGPPVLTPATTRDLILVLTYYARKQ